MLRHLSAMLAVAAAWASVAKAATTLPYRAYVAHDDAYVRSGPGENYYPVDRLARGAVVEVYRHDPGGWLAIRPPSGCFSWVAAEFVEPAGGNLGVIVGEKVTARVGSAFSDIRDVIQVRLEYGEEVEIIEAVRFGDGDDARTWYRIAPPAGEFRWISGEDVTRSLEPRRSTAADERRTTPRDNDESRTRLESDPREEAWEDRFDRDADDLATAGYEDDAYDEYDDRARADADLAARRRAELLARLDRLREARRARRGPVDDDTRARDDQWDPTSVSRPRDNDPYEPARADIADRDKPLDVDDLRSGKVDEHRNVVSSRDWPADHPLRRELADVERELARVVVDEPSYWSLEPLKSRTDALLAECHTAVERGRVRLVQRRIQRFQDIQRRQETLAAVQADTDHRNQLLAGAASAGAAPTASANRRHDGEGRLTQVANASSGAASYALVGPTGEVRYYITPSPGVNLRPYLGRDVGVSGTLGYMPDALTPHVTARRIEAIEGVLRR